jgi:CBS domain-containing protein
MYQPLSAGDLCTRETVVAPRAMPLTEAARLMREHHVGALVVVDEAGAGRVPVGMLTDRDIVTTVIAPDVDVHLLRVEDVTTSEPVAVRESDSLFDALRAMRTHGVRRVVVTDDAGVLQGVLALDDLIEVVAEEMGAIAQALSRGRERELKRRR